MITVEDNDFEIVLLGRKLKGSLPIKERSYKVKRFNLWFNKGPLFYANLNIRLFFYLLFHKSDWLLANDLDTLPANYYAKRFSKKRKLVYDTHEIFCEVPELQDNPKKKKIWLRFEKRIFPKLKKVYTVNNSIANYYFEKYTVKPLVVRNISESTSIQQRTRVELSLPENKFIVIIQGSGINLNRGNEEVVKAFELLNNDFLLLVIGSGDVIPTLKNTVEEKHLQDKIWFKPRMSYHEMMQFTMNSNLGISMDKDTNLNYKFSLPNKLFDFMHAGIPVLASNLPEISSIVNQYETGIILNTHEPIVIANEIKNLKENSGLQQKFKENCKKASEILNWENEKKVLEEIYLQ